MGGAVSGEWGLRPHVRVVDDDPMQHERKPYRTSWRSVILLTTLVLSLWLLVMKLERFDGLREAAASGIGDPLMNLFRGESIGIGGSPPPERELTDVLTEIRTRGTEAEIRAAQARSATDPDFVIFTPEGGMLTDDQREKLLDQATQARPRPGRARMAPVVQPTEPSAEEEPEAEETEEADTPAEDGAAEEDAPDG